jgi:hypothetical protein
MSGRSVRSLLDLHVFLLKHSSYWHPMASSDTCKLHLIGLIGPWPDAPHAESNYLRPSFLSSKTRHTHVWPNPQWCSVWSSLESSQSLFSATGRIRYCQSDAPLRLILFGSIPARHVTTTWCMNSNCSASDHCYEPESGHPTNSAHTCLEYRTRLVMSGSPPPESDTGHVRSTC